MATKNDEISGAQATIKSEASEPVPQEAKLLTDQTGIQNESVVTFVDSSPMPTVEFAPTVDPTFTNDALPHDDLEKFLGRPVKIYDHVWVHGTPFSDVSLNVWHLFFNNAAIKKKIDNYAFINCNLHVKAVINASPFYYGAILAAYQPLTNYSKDIAELSDNRFVSYSQRPHFWIMPQNNQAGELVLPFFYHKNWLDITSSTALQEMGRMHLLEITELLNANNASGGTVTVTFYAWASDVKMTGPTVKLAVQAGKEKKKKQMVSTASGPDDEYGKGPVSSIASAVANAASALIDVPVIGTFAKATGIGASAVSKIASLFGFTNVPVIGDVQPYKSLPFHSLASSGIGEPVSKLTLDPKCELSIDPQTVGLPSGDEMAISYIAQKESYLTQLYWNADVPTDTLLFNARVTPVMSATGASGISTTESMTPMCLLSQNFKYWRGDIIFRFKAICSQYHKGRLRVTWDPVGDIVSNTDTTTTSFTKIFDLTPDMDVEVRVNYAQALHWLNTNYLTSITWQTQLFTNLESADYGNGTLTVRILNELSSPVAVSDVRVLVFVRGAENLEFTNPVNQARPTWSYFAVQSGKENNVHDMAHGRGSKVAEEQYLVYSGEAIKSMRVLLRRSVDAGGFYINPGAADTTSNNVMVNVFQTKYPLPPGYDPNGMYFARSQITPTNMKRYNYTHMSTFCMLLPCYVGMRGSMMWHYNINRLGDPEALGFVRIQRVDGKALTWSNFSTGPWRFRYTYTGASTAESNSRYGYSKLVKDVNDGPASLSFCTDGETGLVMTNQLTQAGISVEYPHYSKYRMVSADPAGWSIGSSVDETDEKYYAITIQGSSARKGNHHLNGLNIERYCSIGTDFNAFFFLNVPTLYIHPFTDGNPPPTNPGS